VAVLAALALLASPVATALADGAGDEQYQDPLTAPATPKKKRKQSSGTPAATTAPATSTAPATATAPASATQSAPPAASDELPRTGAPAGLVALAGAVLSGAGLTLRRRTAHA
jgi:LPXTG-motif cell wall-anchored protein